VSRQQYLLHPHFTFYFSKVISLQNPYNQITYLYSAQLGQIDSTTILRTNLLQEKTTTQRFLRLTNAIFKYDFKVGNYMSDEIKKMNPHLFRTIQDLTTGVRKSS
jgi:hypothetical protein